MDVIYNISKEAIAISVASNKSAVIGTVAVFGALSSFTLFSSLVVLIASEKTFISCCTWLLQVVIVEIYFYGTHMNIIIERFGKELGCVEKCALHNQIAAIGCLGCTLLLLYSIPLLHDYIKKSSRFEHHSLWHYFYLVILVLVHINTVYAAVLSTIPESLKCFREILGLSIVFLVVAIVIGGMSIFSNNDIWNKKDKIWTSHSSIGDKRSNYILKGAVFLLIVILPLYLISNNQLPLQYINCSSAGNSTAADCYDGGPNHVITEHIIKLVGMVVTGVIVLLVMVVFKYQKRAEKLKKKSITVTLWRGDTLECFNGYPFISCYTCYAHNQAVIFKVWTMCETN